MLKQTLHKSAKHGIIDGADAASQIMMLKKQEMNLMKQLINSVHVSKGGAPRLIKYLEAKDLWYTQMPDKSKLYSKTEEGLYQKLLKACGLSLCGMTINGVFEAALNEKRHSIHIKSGSEGPHAGDGQPPEPEKESIPSI